MSRIVAALKYAQGVYSMKRYRTQDRADAPVIHTVEQIGPNRHRTPEGFLLCKDVPLARVGTMLYGPNEVPVKAGRDGIARVTRDASTLFNPTTVASFVGKAVVNEHPPVDVNPANWNKYSVGVVLAARQGVGDDADVILGDLLITQDSAIRDVMTGKREVSAGYEADYEDLGDGQGRQTNILANHIALVERGRCGPRCAIGDNESPSLTKENATMGTKVPSRPATVQRRPIPETIRKLFRDAAEALADEEVADADLAGDTSSPGADNDYPGDAGSGDGHTHIHIHGSGAEGGAGGGDLESRIANLEAMMEQIMGLLTGGEDPGVDPAAGADPAADDGGMPVEEGEASPEGTHTEPDGDEGSMGEELPPGTQKTTDRAAVGDSAALEKSFAQLVSDAEVLVPGFRFPTFDAKQPRKVTMDGMCAMRKRVLDHLHSTVDGKQLIDSVVGDASVDIASIDCATASVIFKAAAGARRAINNSNMTQDAKHVPAHAAKPGTLSPAASIAQLNALHKDYWSKRSAAAAK